MQRETSESQRMKIEWKSFKRSSGHFPTLSHSMLSPCSDPFPPKFGNFFRCGKSVYAGFGLCKALTTVYHSVVNATEHASLHWVSPDLSRSKHSRALPKCVPPGIQTGRCNVSLKRLSQVMDWIGSTAKECYKCSEHMHFERIGTVLQTHTHTHLKVWACFKNTSEVSNPYPPHLKCCNEATPNLSCHGALQQLPPSETNAGLCRHEVDVLELNQIISCQLSHAMSCISILQCVLVFGSLSSQFHNHFSPRHGSFPPQHRAFPKSQRSGCQPCTKFPYQIKTINIRLFYIVSKLHFFDSSRSKLSIHSDASLEVFSELNKHAHAKKTLCIDQDHFEIYPILRT